MAESTAWSVLICTFRRPQLLAGLLERLAHAAAAPGAPAVELVVIDNDPDASATTVLRDFGTNHVIPLKSQNLPEPNIAKARNAAVALATGSVLLFLDDDQMIDITALADLEKIWQANAGTFAGYCLKKDIVPDASISSWLRDTRTLGGTSGDHLQPLRRNAMNSGGLVVRRADLIAQKTMFDEALGRIGGEDVDLLLRLQDSGVRLGFLGFPVVTELLAAERSTLAYSLRSAARKGATDAFLAIREGTKFHRAYETLKALGFLGAAIALVPLSLLMGLPMGGYALARVWRQIGKLKALTGKIRPFYGTVLPSPKILHLSSGAVEGGVERILEQISRFHSTAGAESSKNAFYFYDWQGPKNFAASIVSHGHQIHCQKKAPGIDVRLWLDLRRYLQREASQIIHTYDIGALLHAVIMRLTLRGIRIIHSEHTLHYWIGRRKYRILHRLLTPFCARVTCVSEHVRNELVARVGTSTKNLVVIPNGVNTKAFLPLKPTDQPPISSSQSSHNAVRLRLVAASRLDANKNLDTIFAAMANLRAKGIVIQFDHVGTGSDAYVRSLNDRIAQLGLSNEVKLHGFTADVRPLLQSGDVFISASKEECHPVSVLEAMAVGLPCLLSSIAGHQGFRDQGALLFPLVSSSLEHLIEALALRQIDIAELGARARRVVTKSYSFELMMARYSEIYRMQTF